MDNLKKLKNGWGNEPSAKKPNAKTVKKAHGLLKAIESGRMPFPSVSAIPNGCIILAWISLTRDMMICIDPDGDAQFVSSIKHVDKETGHVLEKIDSEGGVSRVKDIDQMMAWYCADKAFHA